jgi:hypothetical protein
MFHNRFFKQRSDKNWKAYRKQQIHVNLRFLVITVMLIIYMVKIYAHNSVYSAVSNGVRSNTSQIYSVIADVNAVRGP